MATKLIQQLDEKFGLWKNLDEPVKKVDDELLKKAESTIEEKTDQGKKPEVCLSKRLTLQYIKL